MFSKIVRRAAILIVAGAIAATAVMPVSANSGQGTGKPTPTPTPDGSVSTMCCGW